MAALQARQALLLDGARIALRTSLATYRRSRAARDGWAVLCAHGRVIVAPSRHAAQQEALEAELLELAAVRESYDELSWRTTHTRAQIILHEGS